MEMGIPSGKLLYQTMNFIMKNFLKLIAAVTLLVFVMAIPVFGQDLTHITPGLRGYDLMSVMY